MLWKLQRKKIQLSDFFGQIGWTSQRVLKVWPLQTRTFQNTAKSVRRFPGAQCNIGCCCQLLYFVNLEFDRILDWQMSAAGVSGLYWRRPSSTVLQPTGSRWHTHKTVQLKHVWMFLVTNWTLRASGGICGCVMPSRRPEQLGICKPFKKSLELESLWRKSVIPFSLAASTI